MQIGEQFGRCLASQRRKAGLSQEELADLADMHRTAISLSETGKRIPRLDRIAKLANALGISIATLTDGITLPDRHRALRD